jgi:hypothetical protein
MLTCRRLFALPGGTCWPDRGLANTSKLPCFVSSLLHCHPPAAGASCSAPAAAAAEAEAKVADTAAAAPSSPVVVVVRRSATSTACNSTCFGQFSGTAARCCFTAQPAEPLPTAVSLRASCTPVVLLAHGTLMSACHGNHLNCFVKLLKSGMYIVHAVQRDEHAAYHASGDEAVYTAATLTAAA